MQITFLGHATVLIQTEAGSLLTDPVLSDRIFGVIRRRHPLPLSPLELPEPAAIVISHAHYDHLDLPSFKYFSQKIPIVLPKGLGRLLAKFVRNPLIELSSMANHDLLPGFRLTAIPVTHPGFRLSGLTYRAANGYLVEAEGKQVLFAGDTGYRSDFKLFKGVNLALLPVGPCRPEWFMRRKHLNPADTLRVMEETEAKEMIPIHWGTFRLGLEAPEEPIEELKRLVRERGLSNVRILEPGESVAVG